MQFPLPPLMKATSIPKCCSSLIPSPSLTLNFLICIPLFYLITFSANKELLIPALIIISRELIISSFRQFLVENLGSNPIKVSFLAKSKTTVQITALSFLIVSPNFEETFFKFTVFFFWLAAYISLHSLYTYFKAYKNLIK